MSNNAGGLNSYNKNDSHQRTGQSSNTNGMVSHGTKPGPNKNGGIRPSSAPAKRP